MNESKALTALLSTSAAKHSTAAAGHSRFCWTDRVQCMYSASTQHINVYWVLEFRSQKNTVARNILDIYDENDNIEQPK